MRKYERGMANNTIRDWLSVKKIAVDECGMANSKTIYYDALFSKAV